MAELKGTVRVKQTTYAITTMYLIIFLLPLLEDGRSMSPFNFVLAWIMVTLGAVFWPVFTIAWLDDIGWNRRWVAVFALPWTALIIAAEKTPNWIAGAALLLVLVTQSFLVLRGSKRESDTRRTEDANLGSAHE